jgi:D-alanyl-lipoteichoic acid acyltransferase DltB (MBOAT superfamily)
MLFNSLAFAVYFPLVVSLYFVLPQRWRTHWLLVASCVFYMAFIPAYILILAVTIVIDYIAGIYIERQQGGKRKLLLGVSIASTCIVLCVFKYLDFFANTFVTVAGWFGQELSPVITGIVLPIGLSFHTFQSLSYVVEVYRGHQKAEHNFVVYATYVMFFPQLVAGPIERPQNMLHQLWESHHFRYLDVTAGLKRMAWGFFKKLVVADRLAIYVNDVYARPAAFNGLQLTLATVFFAYQIYCDFSGYSDIAIGSAQVMGFRLMENFDRPYGSRSISEFWRRWHISLSTWFKDYVYIPLGGNRVSIRRYAVNLLITFGVSGLWHGAKWTYVCWGLLNGLYLLAGSLTKGWRERLLSRAGLDTRNPLRRALMTATTFLLICVAWILFRSQNLGDAVYILGHLTTGWHLSAVSTPHFLLRQMPAALLGILALEAGQLWQSRAPSRPSLQGWPLPARWAAYATFVLAILVLGVYRGTEFIYFQF